MNLRLLVIAASLAGTLPARVPEGPPACLDGRAGCVVVDACAALPLDAIRGSVTDAAQPCGLHDDVVGHVLPGGAPHPQATPGFGAASLNRARP